MKKLGSKTMENWQALAQSAKMKISKCKVQNAK